MNDQPIVYRGARVILGDGRTVVENGQIQTRSGLIEYVGPAPVEDLPSGVSCIDLHGRTVMPAIINAHGHIGYLKGATAVKANYSRDNVLEHLSRLAYHGVSVFQSLGTDREDVELTVRDEQRAGILSDPSLALLLTANNGFVAPTPGAENGGPFFAADVIEEVATPEQARRGVARIAEKRPDAIKFWVDDRWATKAKFGSDVQAAIVDEGHRHGIPVIAHIFGLDDAKDVVRAGADGIAHMVREPGPDDELLDLLARHNVFCFTSMSIQKSAFEEGLPWLDDPLLAESVSEADREVLRTQLNAIPEEQRVAMARSYEVLESGLVRYLERGVRVVLSADTGLFTQFFGFAEHQELEAMVRAGMPALAAIQAATEVPAAILGLTDRGRLERGKRADFLVLNGNPLDDITHTRSIEAVYIGGQALDRPAMRAAWS